MADLEALPATALQKVADFVHQMRDTARLTGRPLSMRPSDA